MPSPMTGKPQATLIEKIIARAAGREDVRPGDFVIASVDLAFAHDSSGPRRWAPMLADLGTEIWNPAKLAIVSDHYAPATDAGSAAILKFTRDFAQHHGIANFFDMEGICHVVLPEHGLIRPGTFVAGGDSHTPTAGAFGACAMGFGATDMAAIVATGETWLSVPETVQVKWSGRFGTAVTAKDVMLHLCRNLGLDNGFKAIEYAGDVVDDMSMSERMVLCNMAAELGFETGIVAPDTKTLTYLAACGRPIADEAATLALRSDAGARYAQVHAFDAGALVPQIAAPHSPANSAAVADFAGERIDQAYIGACVGAKLEDLRMAAEILRGRRISSHVRLLIAPASKRTLSDAATDGTLQILLDAGATLLPSGCGACAGMGAGLLAEGERCISTTNRNFQGRMGHNDAAIYLGSPYSVAAAAVTGKISDPRELLAEAVKT